MKITRFGSVAVILAMSLAACHATPVADAYTVGVTTLFPTGTFAEFVDRLNEIGPAKGLTFDIQDINNDVSKENQVLTAFATKGVDLVVASLASGTGSLAAVRRVDAAGIPLICYNTCLSQPANEHDTVAFVTNDQEAMGANTGAAVADYVRGHHAGSAEVGYLTCETYDVCKDRRKGLDAALSGIDVKTVASQEGFVVDAATPVATAMLTAHSDIDVLIAENEDGIIAAANAVKARDLQDTVAVFGIGISPTVAKLLLDTPPIVQYSTGQDAAAWADEVVKLAVAKRDGAPTGDYLHHTPAPAYGRTDVDALKSYLATRP